MKRIYRDILILIGAFVIVWFVFSRINGFIDTDTRILTADRQEKLAENLRKIVFQRYDTVDNQVVRTAVDSIAKRLEKAIGTSEHKFNVYILNDTIVNAFATLQGDIYIFSGLIRFSDSPEMLASVIAHEMGHIVNDHYVERLSREIGINVVFTILTGGDASTIGELGKSLFSLSFSRDEEREADKFAGDLLLKAGISPERSTQFFLKLQREDIGNFTETLEPFMTHPDMKERIEETSKFKVPDDFAEKHFDFDWGLVIDQLK